MLKILYNRDAIDRSYAPSDSIIFGLASAPPSPEVCNALVNCRDYLNDYLLYASNRFVREKKSPEGGLVISKRPPDFDKLRLIVGVPDNDLSKKQLLIARRILNIIEKRIGWSASRLMKCEIVNNKGTTLENLSMGTPLFTYVSGPEGWMRFSTLLSVVTYIFKSCFYLEAGELKEGAKLNTIEDVIEFYRENSISYADKKYIINTYITNYGMIFSKNILKIMENTDMLFPKVELDSRFPAVSCVHSTWGIMSYMLNMGVNNSVLSDRRKQSKLFNK